MGKWVLVDMILVYQMAPGLVEQSGIHSNPRNVRTKGRHPQVPGHSPRMEELWYVLQCDILRTPVLVLQMSQTVTRRALPDSTPFHQAPPQLSQLQMNVDHMDVQGRGDLFLPDRAKSRLNMPKRPLRAMTSKTTEPLHLLRTLSHGPKYSLRPSSVERSNIPGEICHDRQVGDAARFSTRTS